MLLAAPRLTEFLPASSATMAAAPITITTASAFSAFESLQGSTSLSRVRSAEERTRREGYLVASAKHMVRDPSYLVPSIGEQGLGSRHLVSVVVTLRRGDSFDVGSIRYLFVDVEPGELVGVHLMSDGTQRAKS